MKTPREIRRALQPASQRPPEKPGLNEQFRSHLEGLFLDTRFGLRMLAKNPGFAAVSILSLAVGIAVNVTVFSCLNTFVFRPPSGVKNPGELVYLQEMVGAVSHSEFEFLRDHNTVFSGIAASAPCRHGVELGYAPSVSPTGTSEPLRQTDYPSVRFVSANYFSLIGTPFTQGRPFFPEEDLSPGSPPVVILSHSFWKRHFNSQPFMVGTTVRLNKTSCVVVGIAPEDFPREPGLFVPPDAWVPFAMQDRLDQIPPGSSPKKELLRGVQFYARLRPGATPGRAESELKVLDDQFAKEFLDPNDRRSPWPGYLESGFSFLPWRPWAMKLLVFLTLSVSGSVLLIACANLASLLLARATARQRELSVRLAMGASRLRLVRQLMTESLMIACFGGVIGLLAGAWAGKTIWPRLAASVLPGGLRESFNFGLDWRVMGFALLLTLATGVIFGLAPALESAKSSLSSALNQESVFLGHHLSRSRLRGLLIVGQVAVSLTFLIGTSLMLRRVQTGSVRDYSFETRRVMMVEFTTPAGNPRQFQPAFLDLLSGIPGVKSASLAQVWYARYLDYRTMRVDGQVPARSSGMALSRVTPGYFATLSLPFVSGRNFTELEAKMEAPLLVVSESFAKKFWPGLNPLGHRLKLDATNAEAQVIGVVKDGVREIRSQYELAPYAGDFYSPLSPVTSEKSEVWVRTEGNPYAIIPVLRRELPSLDSTVGVNGRSLGDMAATWVGPMLFLAATVGVLGALALILASIGVYGIVSYAVRQRTREIGIRTALGAQPAGLLRLMLWEGMRLVVFGMTFGLIGSACLSFILRTYFYGISPVDPVTFLGASSILAAAAALACYIPARRAAKIDPMAALRCE